MRIPNILKDLIPAERLKPILDLANQDKIASLLKEVAEQVGWKGSTSNESTSTKSFPPKELQQAIRQAKWWFDSLSQRFQSASVAPLQQGLNGTGELFSSRWIATPTSTDTVTAISMVHSGFCVSGGLTDSVETKLRQQTDAQACFVTSSVEAAILVLSASFSSKNLYSESEAGQNPESHDYKSKPWIIARRDCIRLPSECDVLELLRSMNPAGVIEVGASNDCQLQDYSRAITNGGGGVFRVTSAAIDEQPINKFSVPTAVLAMTSLLREFNEVPSNSTTVTNDRPLFSPLSNLNQSPSVQSLLGSGIDLVVYPGNGWLGGPLCGIVFGSEPTIEALRATAKSLGLLASTSTMAALRAAVEGNATLDLWLESPIGQISSNGLSNLEHRAKKLIAQLEAAPNISSMRVDLKNVSVGTGLWRSITLESYCLLASHSKFTTSEWQNQLAKRAVPIETLIQDGELVVVLRTINPADDQELVSALLEE